MPGNRGGGGPDNREFGGRSTKAGRDARQPHEYPDKANQPTQSLNEGRA